MKIRGVLTIPVEINTPDERKDEAIAWLTEVLDTWKLGGSMLILPAYSGNGDASVEFTVVMESITGMAKQTRNATCSQKLTAVCGGNK